MIFTKWLASTWTIVLDTAPILLVGLVISAVVQVYFSERLSAMLNTGRQSAGILKATLIGIPLPLCSCSVLPFVSMLGKAGVRRGPIASFLVSTPEIGIDSFLLSIRLLGWPFALARVIVSFFSAMVAGFFVGLFDSEASVEKVSSETASCCHTGVEPQEEQKTRSKNLTAIANSFLDLLDDLVLPLLGGFLIAGLIVAFFPEDFSQAYLAEGIFGLLFALFVSLPIYVCATSMTPVAAALFAKGFSAGAVLVFLLAGPATNVATVLLAKRVLGLSATVRYLIATVFVALLAGYLVDLLFADYFVIGDGFLDSARTEHHHGAIDVVQQAASVSLLLLLFARLALRYRRR